MLNEEQGRACVCPAPVLIIHAGPGSGKTRVITQRVAWLIQDQHLPANGIILVDFFFSRILPSLSGDFH